MIAQLGDALVPIVAGLCVTGAVAAVAVHIPAVRRFLDAVGL